MRKRLAMLVVSLGLLACSSPLPPLPAPPDGTGVQLEMVSTLDPGQETERCKFFVAPPEGLWVNHASVRYTPGSHHVLLFTTNYKEIPKQNRRGETVDTSGIFECADGAAGDWEIDGVAGGAQSADAPDVIELPPGVAVKIPGGNVLIMNTHYLNASPRPLETDARINLYTIPKEEVTGEAGILFFYNPFIRVPANGKASARMSCPITQDVTLFNGQSHMHRRGVGYVADIVDTATHGKIEELYRANDWENIYVKTFDPGKPLQAGTSIDYRCDYENTEDRPVMQGLTTKDEMCMFIGAYYPRNRSMELCAMEGDINSAGSAATFIGSGSNNCLETVLCVQGAKDTQLDGGESLFGCIVDTCEKNTNELNAYFRCASKNGPDACKTELDSCAAARCD